MRISCDDGCASDVRLAKLCKKYEIECIFYWPVEWHSLAYDKGYRPLTYYDATVISHDFEIGSHAVTHQHLTKMSNFEAHNEIRSSREMLNNLFDLDHPPKKFAPPRGYTTPELTEFTLSIYESQRLTKGKDLVHIHPNSGANNNRPWRECITEDTQELWCHSWELDKYNLWQELEDYVSSYSKLRA